jgi:hypothetical protein
MGNLRFDNPSLRYNVNHFFSRRWLGIQVEELKELNYLLVDDRDKGILKFA